MIIITHPKGNLTKKSTGDYEKPNVYDLSGGAMWSNKCDNVLCTYRPYYTSDKANRSIEFTSQKIKKQKLCGIPGDVMMTFRISEMRYHEMDGQYELPNPLEGEKKSVKNFYEKEPDFAFINEDVPF